MGELSFEKVTGLIEYDSRPGGWCTRPYPDHKKGCTNYNKLDRCPPKVCKISNFIDLDKDTWFLINKFDLAGPTDNATAFFIGRANSERSSGSSLKALLMRYQEPFTISALKQRASMYSK